MGKLGRIVLPRCSGKGPRAAAENVALLIQHSRRAARWLEAARTNACAASWRHALGAEHYLPQPADREGLWLAVMDPQGERAAAGSARGAICKGRWWGSSKAALLAGWG